MIRLGQQGHPPLAAVLTMGLTAAGVAEAQEAEQSAESLPAALSEEIKFLKEETVSIASRYEQPISEAPSNVYVITDEDIPSPARRIFRPYYAGFPASKSSR